jgi:hypothetical protein
VSFVSTPCVNSDSRSFIRLLLFPPTSSSFHGSVGQRGIGSARRLWEFGIRDLLHIALTGIQYGLTGHGAWLLLLFQFDGWMDGWVCFPVSGLGSLRVVSSFLGFCPLPRQLLSLSTTGLPWVCRHQYRSGLVDVNMVWAADGLVGWLIMGR